MGDRTITVMKRAKGEPTTLTITKSKDITLAPGTEFPATVIFYYD